MSLLLQFCLRSSLFKIYLMSTIYMSTSQKPKYECTTTKLLVQNFFYVTTEFSKTVAHYFSLTAFTKYSPCSQNHQFQISDWFLVCKRNVFCNPIASQRKKNLFTDLTSLSQCRRVLGTFESKN